MIEFHDKQKEALSYLAIDNECRQLLYGEVQVLESHFLDAIGKSKGD